MTILTQFKQRLGEPTGLGSNWETVVNFWDFASNLDAHKKIRLDQLYLNSMMDGDGETREMERYKSNIDGLFKHKIRIDESAVWMFVYGYFRDSTKLYAFSRLTAWSTQELICMDSILNTENTSQLVFVPFFCEHENL